MKSVWTTIGNPSKKKAAKPSFSNHRFQIITFPKIDCIEHRFRVFLSGIEFKGERRCFLYCCS